MGKIIISESQYRKVKQNLIENAINKSLLNEQSGDFSYTVQSAEVFFENAENSDNPELKIFKGAKFVPDNKGNLVATTKFQFVNSASGEVTMGPATNDEPYDENNKLYTTKDKVYYYCSKGKFKVPTKSQYEYFAEDSPAPELVKELSKLCQKAKTQKSSYGAEAVGGGKSYSQQNNYTLKSDKGTTLTIPKGTGYAFKDGKNGASFRLPGNKFGWFSCPSKTFLVDKVTYKDANGALANNIVKNICTSGSSQPKQTIVGGGGSGSGPGSGGGRSQQLATQDSIVSDMANYI
jgi:hypothetical protein